MMNRTTISILLGLVAAVVFVSATTGPLFIRFLLFLMTPLPIFLAGTGWGVLAALIAGLAGTALTLVLGPGAALIFAASQAIPAAVLTYLAGLSRETVAEPGRVAEREWYPPGRLVIWSAVMAALPTAFWLFAYSGELETLRQTLSKEIAELLKSQIPKGPDGAPLTDEQLLEIARTIVKLLPAASAISWMGALLFNLWLAGRIMLASSQLERPWPDLAALTYSPAVPFVMAAATFASLVGGWPGMAASALSGTFMFAYILLGLAVVHYLSRGNSWRPFLLWGLYTALLFLASWLALPLAILGLAEQFLHLRARAGPRIGAPPS